MKTPIQYGVKRSNVKVLIELCQRFGSHKITWVISMYTFLYFIILWWDSLWEEDAYNFLGL